MKRREKLSPAIRAIEHNVYMHIRKEVRHTGKGWSPLLLDVPWALALKRMLRDGLVLDRPDLGGYVPADMATAMAEEQERVKKLLTKKPQQFSSLDRSEATALGRLVASGADRFDPEKGYSAKS
jgi:hypothetical protein